MIDAAGIKGRDVPKPQTIASRKWNEKAGYRVKSISLKGDLLDEFAEACERTGVSQASVIADAMRAYIDAHPPEDEEKE